MEERVEKKKKGSFFTNNNNNGIPSLNNQNRYFVQENSSDWVHRIERYRDNRWGV